MEPIVLGSVAAGNKPKTVVLGSVAAGNKPTLVVLGQVANERLQQAQYAQQLASGNGAAQSAHAATPSGPSSLYQYIVPLAILLAIGIVVWYGYKKYKERR